MSGLGLLLLFSFFVCGSFEDNYTSTQNMTSSANLTGEPTKASLPVTVQWTPTSHSPKLQPTTTTASGLIKQIKGFYQEFIVCGILIVACIFFLMTTILLTCKVCKLSRRIRMLSRSLQLNSDSDFLETKNGKNRSGGEDKETTVLMSYVTQTNQELDSAATEPDGGKTEEDGQKSEDKKEGDFPAAAAAESSTFSQPQEGAVSSETTPAAAAAAPASPSSSEGTEEPSNQP